MKVLHSISGLNLSSGGPSLSTWSLVTGLRYAEINAEIITYQDDRMIGKGAFIQTIKSPRFRRFGYSNILNDFFRKADYDLYHGHGLWQYPVHAMANSAYKKGKPYIISPRGMLYPEAKQKSTFFKMIAMYLFQKKDLRRATIIHTTCFQELSHIRNLGFLNPVALIPNSIEINIPPQIQGVKSGKQQIGFIGRFAPIKNIEHLINAWATTGRESENWELVLIGDGEFKYMQSLKRLAQTLGIVNIRFTGFLNGDEKEKALQSLSYLVLPSKSENFGMVVPEALIHEIPVIASKGTPWEELNTYNAGWWIERGVKPLVEALRQAMQQSDEERQLMGRNGRKLVEENYSIESVAAKMIQLYNWILESGEKPEFVYLNQIL